MHAELIRSGTRRVVVTAVAGTALLAVTVAAVLFPIVWLGTAVVALAGGPWSFGWAATAAAAVGALLLGAPIAVGVVVHTWRHADRDVLFDARAWPRPLPGRDVHAVGDVPPALASVDLGRVQRAATVMAIPYGIPPPRVALIDDPALNSLSIGRGADAWIVVTTGLLATMPEAELDAVLAFQIARVAVREVSLDTVVYACTGKVIEVWGGTFDELDETVVLLFPALVLATPFVLAAWALRLATVRAGARLGDGLALRARRDPTPLVRALRRIEADPAVVRNAERATAHLWLEYPHTRASRLFFRSRSILPARIERLTATGSRGGGTMTG